MKPFFTYVKLSFFFFLPSQKVQVYNFSIPKTLLRLRDYIFLLKNKRLSFFFKICWQFHTKNLNNFLNDIIAKFCLVCRDFGTSVLNVLIAMLVGMKSKYHWWWFFFFFCFNKSRYEKDVYGLIFFRNFFTNFN